MNTENELISSSGRFSLENPTDDKKIDIDKIILRSNNVFEGWNNKEVKGILAAEWLDWVLDLTDWSNFITLTFRIDKFPDVARSLFQWWVKENNKALFGCKYSRKVGHSYFSYLVGMEYQRRDVIHFHAIVDRPINYKLTHKIWGDRCGFAWIDGDLKDKKKTINYICKYVLKGGDLDLYLARKDLFLQVVPDWWGSSGLSRVQAKPKA